MPRFLCTTKQPSPYPPYILTLRTTIDKNTLHCKMYLVHCLLFLSPWMISSSKNIITSFRKHLLCMQKTYHKIRFWARWYILHTIYINTYQCGNNEYNIWGFSEASLPILKATAGNSEICKRGSKKLMKLKS